MDIKENIKNLFTLVQGGEEGYDEELHEAVDDYLEDRKLEQAFEMPEDFTIHLYDEVDASDSERLFEDDLMLLTVDEVDEATLARTFRVWLKS